MATNFRVDQMGTIYVTDDLNFVRKIPYDMAKIISLDEDKTLDPNSPNVIVGTCLLPPMEAYIAESDGDEDLYNIHYMTYLNAPGIYEFIGALIAALYKRMDLVIYAPQLNKGIAIVKLRELLWTMYGIGVGRVGHESCEYDPRCIPIWLNMMYEANVISAYEFLYKYPDGVQFNTNIISKLIHDMNPVSNSYEESIKEIERYHKAISKKVGVRPAIYGMR